MFYCYSTGALVVCALLTLASCQINWGAPPLVYPNQSSNVFGVQPVPQQQPILPMSSVDQYGNPIEFDYNDGSVRRQLPGSINFGQVSMNPQNPFSPQINVQPAPLYIGSNLPQPQSAWDPWSGQITSMTVEQWEEYERYSDRRFEEGWYHLYPFGSRYNDADIGSRPYHDAQIDFNFDFPYYGFWFNYSIIYPNGLVAFSVPEFIQPPYTFPNPRWPDRKDASFIAAFYTEQMFQHVGEKRISHVWYRTVHRPKLFEQRIDQFGNPISASDDYRFLSQEELDRRLRRQWGYVEDPFLLDNITRDIQEGIIGANGFRADHAVIITWERMAYGGAPKITQVDRYREVLTWQNTYQVAIVSDEIRSYVILNYAHLNWTSSTTAGSLAGKGGLQSAMAGFNGGNGTGWTPLPYAGEGRIHKLDYFSNVGIPGRWVYRVDEQIIPGGCSNESIGVLYTAPIAASMLGGLRINVSGPCFRFGDVVKVIFDEYEVDCEKTNMHRAQCILPVDKLYKTGLVVTRLSRDGGVSFPYDGTFYVLQPALAEPQIKLIDDPKIVDNSWRSINASQLTLEWAPLNLTGDPNAMIDISLWGYWEDTDNHEFRQVGVIAERLSNSGKYQFNPRTLANKYLYMGDAWKKFGFGAIRISVSDIREDRQHGVFWSKLTPFGWYFVERWTEEYGRDWALDKCIEWYDYDGQRLNFAMDLEPHVPCPCTLDQALLDIGRYTALFDCNLEGDTSCNFNKGSQHCVLSVEASWTGAGQVCCYDFEGWLLHSDDYENAAYLRFYSPGVAARGHPFGSYPFKRPPYVPSLSNYFTDRMAFQYCCVWAGRCEFYYWRRQTSGCQEYRPPGAAYAFGEPHFVTFDGQRYSFQGKGYFVLTYIKDHIHDLMIQVRMEQPPKTVWNVYPSATVITGIAIQENQSDVLQILARKEFRRFRYKTDILVNGRERYFDTPEMKLQQFKGFSLRSPERNHNQSDILVMLGSGAGIRVQEAYGILSVMVVLPPHFNQSNILNQYSNYHNYQQYAYGVSVDQYPFTASGNERTRFVTLGLLGTFNGRREDDLMTPDGASTLATYPPDGNELRRIYEQFGRYWRVDGARWRVLFQDNVAPIYNPILFASQYYLPEFEITRIPINASLIFTPEEVASTCHERYECMYDYVMTGQREIALATIDVMYKLEGLKDRGSRIWLSCGALIKAEGAVKHPPGNNYLDGVTVTFSCKPEYFLHGDQQRTCINGTWSPGWWVWCRSRSEENALKWLTGILTVLLFVGAMTVIFLCCYYRRKHIGAVYRTREPVRMYFTGESKNTGLQKPTSVALAVPAPDPVAKDYLDYKTSPDLPELDSEPVPLHQKNFQRKYLYSETPQ